MSRFFTRMATPPSKQRGFQLAVLAVVMTASPWVVTLWFAVTASSGGYDYAGSHVPLVIGTTLGYLGVVPLLFAIIALVGQPVRPAGLVPVALLLALCQPVVTVLGTVGLLPGADLGLALLMLVFTGSSFGVVAAGLVPVDRRFRAAVMLLIAVGVSVAATAAFMVQSSVGMSLIVAILLGVAIAHDRKDQARLDVLTPEDAAERHGRADTTNRLFTRMATPPSKQRGFQLAVLTVVMTSAPHVVNLAFLFVGRNTEEYDYALSGWVLAVGGVIGQLGVVPLLFAIIALVGRPVRPAGLIPVALLLALCQPIVTVLGAVGPLTGEEMGMSLGEAILMTMVTGSAVGLVAAGLVLVARPSRAAMTLLTAIGVAVVATAAFMVVNGVGMSLLVAILLRVAILRDRKNEARHADLAQESPV